MESVSCPSVYITGAPNAFQDRTVEGVEDLYMPGFGAEVAAPLTGSTPKQTAGGPAPDQIQRVFVNEIVNPTNTDSTLYTVTNTSTTLSAAVTAKTTIQLIPLTSSSGITTGPFVVDSVASGVQETVWITVTGVGAAWGVFRNAHASGATFVSAGRTFLMTDFVVTTSAASAGVSRLKARTTATSGSNTAGVNTISFANPDYTQIYGDITYIGQYVYLEDPSSGAFELVKVTAVTRNASGIVTSFTGTTTQTHTGSYPVAFPIALAGINSTKGIEIIGQETQPHCPGGMALVVHFGAVTGTVMQNVAGIEQP